MANNISQVGFQSPGYDYSADLAQIQRRQELAQALQQQAGQSEGTQVVNGWAVPQSPLAPLVKALQGGAAGYMRNKSEQGQRDLAAKAQSDYTAMLAKGLQQLQGSPANTIAPDPQENSMAADQGTPQVGPVNIPAQAPNPAAALATFGSHPMGAMMAPLAMQALQRQQLMETVRQMQGGQAGNQMSPDSQNPSAMAGSGAMVPPSAPKSPVGGPAGGMPMAWWLTVDPSGKLYSEQLAKDQAPINVRPGGTVFIPGKGPQYTAPQGGLQTTYGANGPQVGVLPGFEQAQGQINSIPNPSAPLIAVKTSTGQDIQLTQPEYVQWQRTQQLPARYGQTQGPIPQSGVQPIPGKVPPQDMPAFNAVASGQVPAAYGKAPADQQSKVPGEIPPEGIGVPGMGQSQQEQIRQSGQKEANTEAAKEFISEMRKNYGLLRDVPATLQNMERSKQLAQGSAAQFVGPLGESKLQITKFLRSNMPGMSNLNTEGVKNVEELRSTLFNQVMDNLKKMDASPSQYQQQVMQQAFGTLGTDPAAIPNILDVFGDILRTRVDIHNQTVQSAESRGTAFPYDISIKVPKASPAQRNPAGAASQQSGPGKVTKWSDLQ